MRSLETQAHQNKLLHPAIRRSPARRETACGSLLLERLLGGEIRACIMAVNELAESYVQQREERRENGASHLQNASFERATSDLPDDGH